MSKIAEAFSSACNCGSICNNIFGTQEEGWVMTFTSRVVKPVRVIWQRKILILEDTRTRTYRLSTSTVLDPQVYEVKAIELTELGFPDKVFFFTVNLAKDLFYSQSSAAGQPLGLIVDEMKKLVNAGVESW